MGVTPSSPYLHALPSTVQLRRRPVDQHHLHTGSSNVAAAAAITSSGSSSRHALCALGWLDAAGN